MKSKLVLALIILATIGSAKNLPSAHPRFNTRESTRYRSRALAEDVSRGRAKST